MVHGVCCGEKGNDSRYQCITELCTAWTAYTAVKCWSKHYCGVDCSIYIITSLLWGLLKSYILYSFTVDKHFLLSTAESTTERQASLLVLFINLVVSPQDRNSDYFRLSSTALSQKWLGLPAGRLQLAGGLWISAAVTQWWSLHGNSKNPGPYSRNFLGKS